MEAFSDGVFAIAITLLVLDLHVPEVGDGSLAHALVRQWPADASYAVSFLTIGIIWINHHGLMRHIDRCDRVLLSLNIFLLMMIAIVPYPTALISHYARSPNATAAAVYYGAVMVTMALIFNALWHYAIRAGLLVQGADPRGLVDLEVEAVQDRARAERLHGASERDQGRHRAGTVPAR